MMEYFRNCPTCNKVIEYANESNYNLGVHRNSRCMPCFNAAKKKIDDNLTRICPGCSKEIKYKRNTTRHYAELANRKCRECFYKEYSNRIDRTKPKKESKLKGKKQSQEKAEKSREALKKARKHKNHAKLYNSWLDKYGEEIANKKLAEYKEKMRNVIKGLNKLPVKGSSFGWSGWYKAIHFRSLLELSYMVEFLSASGCVWETAETDKFKIEYIDVDGLTKNYYPDFFVNNKYLVEIKPKNKIEDETVKLKKFYAEIYCKENGFEYLIFEPKKISKNKIYELFLLGDLKLYKKYEERLLKKFQQE